MFLFNKLPLPIGSSSCLSVLVIKFDIAIFVCGCSFLIFEAMAIRSFMVFVPSHKSFVPLCKMITSEFFRKSGFK